MVRSKDMEQCMYKDAVPNLKTTMDFLKEQVWEMRTDLKEHIKAEDSQIYEIKKIIIDWQEKHNADSKEWRAYAEKRFVSWDTLKIWIWILWAIVTTAWVLFTLLQTIHPIL